MRFRLPLAVTAGSLGLALAAAALLPGRPSVRAQDAPDRKPLLTTDEAGDIAEAILDQVIEQGLLPPRIDWADPLLAKRTIVLHGEINRNSAHDVVSKILLLGRDPAPIDLYVRSDGGYGDDAFAITGAMRSVKAPVNTWGLGSCDSAAAIIVAGGTGRRRAVRDAIFSLHFNEDDGDKPWTKERVSREREAAYWKRVATLPDSFFPLTGDKEFYLSGEEAVRLGVVDELSDTFPKPR